MKNWIEEDFMNHNQWYHATPKRYCESVLKHIIADINKDVELDFGFGFYLCPNFEWAKKYAKGIEESGEEEACIIEYHFTPKELLDGDKNYRFFNELNTEFADFVFANRMFFEDYPTNCTHNYLLVGGVMSDGEQPVDFEKYRLSLMSKEELYHRICLPKEDWQIVIHSQELCDKLKPYYVYDLKGGVRDVYNGD